MGLVESYFRTYTSDGTEHIASPDPPTREEATPFVVRVGSKYVIPANVLVFARDEGHARRRVLLALEECCAKDHGGQKRVDTQGAQHAIMALLRSGEYALEVEPLDIALMPGVQWAGNDGI